MWPQRGLETCTQGCEAECLTRRDRDRPEDDPLGLEQHHDRNQPARQVIEPAREGLACERITLPRGRHQMFRQHRPAVAAGEFDYPAPGGDLSSQPIAPGVASDVGFEAARKPTGAGESREFDR